MKILHVIGFYDQNMFFIAPQNGLLIRHIDIIDSIYNMYQKADVLDEKILEPLNDIKKDRGNNVIQ